MSNVTQVEGVDTEVAIIRFSVASYIGRDIVLRKKSFTEVWAEIGGCWASALLLVSIFFVRRSTTRQDGSSVDTQVLRFRGEHSKIEMLKELRSYLEDHGTVVEDVTGKSAPEAPVAPGPVLLNQQADQVTPASQQEKAMAPDMAV